MVESTLREEKVGRLLAYSKSDFWILGNLVFLVIRQRLFSVQSVLAKGAQVSKQMLSFASS